MLSRLVLQRVSSRAFAPNVTIPVGLRSALVARQHLARTFLTTAHVSEPVAKDSESKTSKPKAKTTTTKKAATKKTTATKKTAATKKAAGTTKAAAKKPMAKPQKAASLDPEARLKGPLMTLKLKKDEKPPTGSPTAYSLFMREQYVVGPKVTNRDEFFARSREVAAHWNQLSDEVKKPYYDKEKELRADYKAKLTDWFTTTNPRIINAYNKQRKASKKKRVHAPFDTHPGRPVPPFIEFQRDIRDQVEFRTDLPHREAMGARARALGEKWNALPEQERERYKSQYRDAMKEYKLESPKAEATEVRVG